MTSPERVKGFEFHERGSEEELCRPLRRGMEVLLELPLSQHTTYTLSVRLLLSIKLVTLPAQED